MTVTFGWSIPNKLLVGRGTSEISRLEYHTTLTYIIRAGRATSLAPLQTILDLTEASSLPGLRDMTYAPLGWDNPAMWIMIVPPPNVALASAAMLTLQVFDVPVRLASHNYHAFELLQAVDPALRDVMFPAHAPQWIAQVEQNITTTL